MPARTEELPPLLALADTTCRHLDPGLLLLLPVSPLRHLATAAGTDQDPGWAVPTTAGAEHPAPWTLWRRAALASSAPWTERGQTGCCRSRLPCTRHHAADQTLQPLGSDLEVRYRGAKGTQAAPFLLCGQLRVTRLGWQISSQANHKMAQTLSVPQQTPAEPQCSSEAPCSPAEPRVPLKPLWTPTLLFLPQ